MPHCAQGLIEALHTEVHVLVQCSEGHLTSSMAFVISTYDMNLNKIGGIDGPGHTPH